MSSTETIVRCLKSDLDGDLEAAAEYAERIAYNASLNPWADAADAPNYSEAGRRLRVEIEARKDS